MVRLAKNIPVHTNRAIMQSAVDELRNLPRYVTGTLPDIHGYGRRFKMFFAYRLLEKIHDAFLAKSDGGIDETGMRWKPLKRETIAQRPLASGEATAFGIRGLGRSGRGLLTVSQNKRWKGIFASTYRRLLLKVGEAEAKRLAAKLAWAILKSEGAKTKLATLGGRKVPIMVVSHRLEKSLRPGSLSDDSYSPPEEQIFQGHWGAVTIGSKVPYASAQHKRRPLWPSLAAQGRAGWTAGAAKFSIKKLHSFVKA